MQPGPKPEVAAGKAKGDDFSLKVAQHVLGQHPDVDAGSDDHEGPDEAGEAFHHRKQPVHPHGGVGGWLVGAGQRASLRLGECLQFPDGDVLLLDRLQF
ncbi:MAG: hypothetical protein EBU53_05625, partial [Proteobacteria bacterium]|nr:hypothetical protein [Pseudomonadota bacterium]